MVKRFLTSTSFLLMCFLSGAISLAGCNRSSEAPAKGPQIVSNAEVRQLKHGMTLEEVRTIIGNPGKEVSKAEMPGRALATYSWQNPDGSGVTVMFENDRLASASPVNLL